MMKTAVRSTLALAIALAGCAGGVDSPNTVEENSLGFLPSKNLRIAVVGAGPSGLTAADTLKSQGYQKVTVFEQGPQVGGKVLSFHNGSNIAELGAVFASPDYTTVLAYANKYNIPYTAYNTTQNLVDTDGQVLTPQAFLTKHYSTVQILAAVAAYGAAQVLFAGEINGNGFAWQLPDLAMPFNQFAAKYGFTPIAELARSVMVGFGYGYYETAPAAYYMKLLPWLVKIGGSSGLQQATFYTFPTGYQSLWQAVAAGLNVQLNSQVTKIDRHPGTANPVTLTINGTSTQNFDVVIISAPLNKVSSFMTLTSDEAALFPMVQGERYLVDLFAASGLPFGEVLWFHNNAFPTKINHINVWANRDATNPIFVGYQIADPSLSLAQLQTIEAGDVASQGGTFLGNALVKDWTNYFPHVDTNAFHSFFYERVEALQGKNNTFYVGGTLSFETVEHSARYAQALVKQNFPTPLF
jgi:oxygen-dependent protoporphyrinogen oxidase